MKSTQRHSVLGRRVSHAGTWLVISTGVLGTGVLTAAIVHDQQDAVSASSQEQTDDDVGSVDSGNAGADTSQDSSSSDSGTTSDGTDSGSGSSGSTGSSSSGGSSSSSGGYASSGRGSSGSTHARTQGS
ncbi:hypothetical protein [Pseudoclavibacter soli]|uniref:hypothetical protein n=1 Tax=Pseudoclavibacter soli TaxID=452623 RepID=UPI000417FD0F|nr:hypothetical protein [Pseudoclavibacter soli]